MYVMKHVLGMVPLLQATLLLLTISVSPTTQVPELMLVQRLTTPIIIAVF
jgi:hypothetical protein